MKKPTFDPLKGLVTKEARQHHDYGVTVTSEGRRRAYNMTGTVHDVLLKKGLIDSEQHASANKILDDFTRSQFCAGMKSCLNITIGGSSRAPGIQAGFDFKAYDRFSAAVQSVHGRKFQKLMIRVCCMGEWLKQVEDLNIPEKKRMAALSRALDELTAHYNKSRAPHRHIREEENRV